MTDDSMIPDWMKREQEKEKLQETARREFEENELLLRKIVEKDGPKFWQSLKEKLQISVQSLHALNLAGSFGLPLGDPRHIHIEVERRDHFPQLANTDIYFDGDSLRCTGLNIGSYQARFVVATDSTVVVSILDEPHKMMNPDSAAEYIMRRMVNVVKTGVRPRG